MTRERQSPQKKELEEIMARVLINTNISRMSVLEFKNNKVVTWLQKNSKIIENVLLQR